MSKENKKDRISVSKCEASGMDRRNFLRLVGKTIGVVALTHFIPVGAAASSKSGNCNSKEAGAPTRDLCSPVQTNYCEDAYTCTAASTHSCKNRFNCGTFTCQPTSANTSNDACQPTNAFSE